MRLNPLSIGSQPSLSTLLSASVEPFRRNKSASEDESVDSFLRRRFGDGVADLASAGMHGIYAASSAQLSARAVLGKVHDVEQQYGSVLYGMWRRSRTRSAKKEKADEAKRWEGMGQVAKDKDDWAMYGLKGGLHTLTDALHQRLKAKGVEIRMNESVNSLLAVDGQVKVSLPGILALMCRSAHSPDPLKRPMSSHHSRLGTLDHYCGRHFRIWLITHIPTLALSPSSSLYHHRRFTQTVLDI